MEKESRTIMSAVLAKGLQLLTGGDTLEGDNLGGNTQEKSPDKQVAELVMKP